VGGNRGYNRKADRTSSKYEEAVKSTVGPQGEKAWLVEFLNANPVTVSIGGRPHEWNYRHRRESEKVSLGGN